MPGPVKIQFLFPRWPPRTLWGHFRYKFPALGLLTLAGATPPGYEVEFLDENLRPADFGAETDVVAISVMTPLAPRAYELADGYRKAGKTVVLGGIHPSCFPEEAGAHADAVIVGEGEILWRRFLDDYERRQVKKVYRAEAPPDLAQTLPARRDLLEKGAYITRSTIQLGRGCPHDCEYCSVTAFSGRQFRSRPVDRFVEEFKTLEDRFVFIVDDNIVAHRPTAVAVFDRLLDAGKWWGSQAPITVADDPDLLARMARSGCKTLFVGFESLNQDNLRKMGKGFVHADKNAGRIRRIQDLGIGILGSFIVGLDGDDERVFDGLHDFILRNRLEAFLISVLTPFPGTRLTARLEEEGRILSRDWSLYDMNTVVYRPRNFTPERLQERFDELNRSLYSLSSIVRRTIKPRKNMVIFVPQNLGYREAWRKLEASRA